ncbi:hypothetical protein T265_05302 [Opisthorchis viverrini]|uniref:Uncharacterized protein n=1 Tax=Opisthorchis viverrini TaxID=6198 RepID=A0A074ZK39_OPIVI|nr:hypothetical protein T265_05302 [Opisthorchis viverrini]KER27668.1 hypothetical protein T265_05302 [Opisthorchis viverrini]
MSHLNKWTEHGFISSGRKTEPVRLVHSKLYLDFGIEDDHEAIHTYCLWQILHTHCCHPKCLWQYCTLTVATQRHACRNKAASDLANVRRTESSMPGDMIVSLRIPTLSMCLLSLVLLKEMDAGLWRQAQVIPSDEGGLGPVVAEFFPQRFGKRFIMTGKVNRQTFSDSSDP